MPDFYARWSKNPKLPTDVPAHHTHMHTLTHTTFLQEITWVAGQEAGSSSLREPKPLLPANFTSPCKVPSSLRALPLLKSPPQDRQPFYRPTNRTNALTSSLTWYLCSLLSASGSCVMSTSLAILLFWYHTTYPSSQVLTLGEHSTISSQLTIDQAWVRGRFLQLDRPQCTNLP